MVSTPPIYVAITVVAAKEPGWLQDNVVGEEPTLTQEYPADAVETLVPNAEAAVRMLADKDPVFLRYVKQRRSAFDKHFGNGHAVFVNRSQNALLLAYARLAMRHGTWGADLHHYHNEGHALEILTDRINYLCEKAGADAIDPEDWVMLTLFAATHDLRQRETTENESSVGANEKASIEEAHRILAQVGFDRATESQIYEDLKMMIAGSTFNVRSATRDSDLSPAEAASSSGALAPTLVQELDRDVRNWRQNKILKRRVRLTLIASDLDTANVAEPLIKFAKSAVRLCREIEFRSHRDLAENESARTVLSFLTQGQETYFFELHQFDSKLGQAILGPMKDRNAPLIKALCTHLRRHFGPQPGASLTGETIIREFMHKASEISGRAAKTSPGRH